MGSCASTLRAIGVAGVGVSQPVAAAVFPARRKAGGINTGAAIRNLEAGPMTVTCQLMRKGAVLEETEIPLAANGQAATFIDELFETDTSDFVGVVRCGAADDGRFTGVALEMDPGNRIFTTLPLIPFRDDHFAQGNPVPLVRDLIRPRFASAGLQGGEGGQSPSLFLRSRCRACPRARCGGRTSSATGCPQKKFVEKNRTRGIAPNSAPNRSAGMRAGLRRAEPPRGCGRLNRRVQAQGERHLAGAGVHGGAKGTSHTRARSGRPGSLAYSSGNHTVSSVPTADFPAGTCPSAMLQPSSGECQGDVR